MAFIQLTDEYNSQGGVGGTCYLCNASKRTTDRPERIITTNMEVDYDAEPGVWPVKWLEFCETCVTEMAHLLGMKTSEEAFQLVQQIDQLIEDREDLEQKLGVAMDQLKAVEWLKPIAPLVPVAPVVTPPEPIKQPVQMGRRR
jgi:hypothetical protein